MPRRHHEKTDTHDNSNYFHPDGHHGTCLCRKLWCTKVKGNQNCPRYMKSPGQNWASLTEEQQTQLKALHQKFVDDTANQRASMVSKQEEIRILMETSAPDRDKLITLSAGLADEQKAVMAKGIDLALEAKKIAPELRLPMFFRSMGIFPGKGGFHGHKKDKNATNSKWHVQDKTLLPLSANRWHART